MTQAHIINNRPRLSGAANARYTGCPQCGRALSIAEVIERHCENCGRQTEPEEMRQTPVLPGSQPITNSVSLTPP
ncbi:MULTISPECIES: hypothetical protein [Rhizobium]|uniref:hypothetical protein n=1 Tax=Rhizobium TaxID=379 RepID=UPI0007E9BC3B|nr:MULTISPECIES: hypothetical protein [Rhizobium]ANK90576.1 hypothetical protein AMK01_CH01068 [Rhizobium sp. N6212]ANK96605.1 hypothetical protein AMK00_CH01070 [Rhizobium sp. N621]ANL02726.1 hypothetical protein AMJ99_CH01139 [Rhizobium esperanzae]ANL08775.1 hypothetical protein AMJ98_CH01060 [Rhizobium sp. N1341]ANL20823.1 hypothetical protein AMJ96_CH01063 [Rhizobium sp. N113]